MSAPASGTACRIDVTNKVFQLGPRAVADEVVTEQDVQDTAKLARLLCRVLSLIAALRRQWAPRRVDFEDIVVGATPTSHRLQHNFAGRVRWWVIDWIAGGAAAAPILLRDSANTDANTLVLLSSKAGTVSIRVEEAG